MHVVYGCVRVFFWVCMCSPGLCALMLSTVWPSLVLPAVLTLVCVDSKHSCRSQRPRSGRTRGSEGQSQRGERAHRVHGGRKGKVELQGKASSLAWHWALRCVSEIV